MGDYIRLYSESQFNKEHSSPKVIFDCVSTECEFFFPIQDQQFHATKDKAMSSVDTVIVSLVIEWPALLNKMSSPCQNVYKPQRRYRKPASSKRLDEEIQVHSTLLEYGRYG